MYSTTWFVDAAGRQVKETIEMAGGRWWWIRHVAERQRGGVDPMKIAPGEFRREVTVQEKQELLERKQHRFFHRNAYLDGQLIQPQGRSGAG